MLADVLALARRLLDLVDTETARLEAGETAAALAGLAEEKTRLADELAHMKENMKQVGRVALQGAASSDIRHELQQTLGALEDALRRNGQVLMRKKQLSESLMASVLAEARRLTRTEATVYGAAASTRPRAAALSYNNRV